MFRRLEAGILPQDSPPVVELPHRISFDAEIDADGRIPEKCGIGFAILPRKFQALSRDVQRQLSDYASNFIKTLRWIQSAFGGQSPFAFVQFQWSWDKACWQNMPDSLHVRVTSHKGIDTSSQAIEQIRAMWASEETEPLAHELVREARDIPDLHSALTVTNTSFPLKKEDKDYLTKWITQRNQVAHGLKKDVNIYDLLVFIEFVQAVLYKLDVCRGHEWAESFAVFKSEVR